MNKIYFTIEENFAGFTDQLLQFAIIYTLGRYLGYEYVHSNLRSFRSRPAKEYTSSWFIRKYRKLKHRILSKTTKSKDIYDLLGINKQLNNNGTSLKKKNFKHKVIIDIKEVLNAAKNYKNTEEIKNNIEELINGISGPDKILLVFKYNHGKKETIRLQKFLPAYDNYIDFYEIYKNSLNTRINESLFDENGKIKLLLHIRQGDSGAIKTPWNTYIPVYQEHPGFMREHNSLEEVNGYKDFYYNVFETFEYYEYLQMFFKYFPEELFSILIFSDGYTRTYNNFKRHMQKLNLGNEQKNQILQSFSNYQENNFNIFKQIKNCKCIIGESEDQLLQLVDSVLESDITICTIQMRFIQKLTRLFNSENNPDLIVLQKREKNLNSVVPDKNGWVMINESIYKTNYSILKKNIPILN